MFTSDQENHGCYGNHEQFGRLDLVLNKSPSVRTTKQVETKIYKTVRDGETPKGASSNLHIHAHS